jgi:pilus assembly protein CpaB
MSKGGRIILAVGFGLLAALFGMLYLSSQRNQLLGSAEVIRVYVATKDIKPGAALEESFLTTREVPKAFLQPQAILVKEFPDKAKVRGVALVPIKEGEQIVRTKLYEGAPPPLSAEMTPKLGKVAVGINVKGLPNVIHGLITAGDHVDVLASFEFEKSKDEQFTEVRPLYQYVRVLAVNDRTEGTVRAATAEKSAAESPDKIIKSVTLEMAPGEAQQMVLAQKLGEVWLLLRAQDDKAPHQYEIWNNERLLQSPYKLWRVQSREEILRDAMSKR